MNSRISRFAALVFITLSVIPVWLAAQDQKPVAPRYKMKDVGNLHDFNAWLFVGPPSFRVLNNLGMVVDAADTGTNDPYQPPFTDGSVNHAVRWQNGVLTDLGSLRPNTKNSSAP